MTTSPTGAWWRIGSLGSDEVGDPKCRRRHRPRKSPVEEIAFRHHAGHDVLLDGGLGYHLPYRRFPLRGITGADLILSRDPHFVDDMQRRAFRLGLLSDFGKRLLDKRTHFLGVLFMRPTGRLLRRQLPAAQILTHPLQG